MSIYTTDEILARLDDNSTYNFFLDLEHGYFYTAGSRINLFADSDRWAIVFEKSGFANRAGRAEIELNYFGNCLLNLDRAGLNDKFICNSKYFTIISGEEFEKVEGDFELVSKKAKYIKVRDAQLSIEQDSSKYESIGIQIQDFDNPENMIDYQSLVRYLNEYNSELFKATNEELRTSIPLDLPLLMKIDNWHHRTYTEYDGEKPSSYETFQLIAEILVRKDIDIWNPTLKPNNDWRNWPEAGTY